MSQTATTSAETLSSTASKRKRNRRKKPTAETTAPSQQPKITLRAPEPIYTVVKSNSAPSEINSVSIIPISSEAGKPTQTTEKPASKSSSKKRKNRKKNNPTNPSSKPACCETRDDLSCFELICPHSSRQQLLTNQQPKLESRCAGKKETSERTPDLLHLRTLSDSIAKKLASLDSTSISITLIDPESEKANLTEDLSNSEVDSSSTNLDTKGTMPQNTDPVMSDTRLPNKGETKKVNSCLASGKNKFQQKEESKADANSQMEPHQRKPESASEKVEVPSEENGVVTEKTKAQLKAERKAAFEAQRAAELAAQGAAGAAGAPGKSKAELRAERRALQEAQRLAKAQSKPQQSGVPKETSSGEGNKPATGLTDGEPLKSVSAQCTAKDSKVTDLKGQTVTEPTKKAIKKSAGDLRMLSHLHQNPGTLDHLRIYGLPGSTIHPAVLKVGFQMAKGIISGSNSRCIAMLHAFRSVIKDYSGQAKKRVSQDIREQLDADIEFLNKCRPLSVSMQNAVTFLKGHLSEVQDNTPTHEVKENLVLCIDKFVLEEINLARKQIAALALTKILDGDVILTYSHSSLVKYVLKNAHKKGKKFRVIVVDSRPRLEGRDMLRYLTGLGIGCTYILVNAVSYIMKEVTKVMLGAHSLLANGYVTSRIGSSQIALVARAKNVPVLVCCETYKFSERVHTDSFVSNELGATSQLLSNLPPSVKMDDLRDLTSLTLLNLTYDVTPPEFVDMVITEKGMLPCTSVPVVLRMRHAGLP